MFTRVLADGCAELLRLHGLDVSPLAPDDARPAIEARDMIALVPFEGGVIEGKLLLAASPEALVATLPFEPDGVPTREVLLDWARELSNQILGRVKERLVRRGTDMAVGVPVAFSGENAPFGLLDPFHTVGLTLGDADHHLFTCFEVHVREGFRLTDVHDPETGLAGHRLL